MEASDVVPWPKTIHQPVNSVDDILQQCDGRVRQTGKQSIAIVELCQHEHCHDVGSDVMTEQAPNLMQASQLEETCLRHHDHMGLRIQLAIKVDSEVVD